MPTDFIPEICRQHTRYFTTTLVQLFLKHKSGENPRYSMTITHPGISPRWGFRIVSHIFPGLAALGYRISPDGAAWRSAGTKP
jgi:hypothetical protein